MTGAPEREAVRCPSGSAPPAAPGIAQDVAAAAGAGHRRPGRPGRRGRGGLQGPCRERAPRRAQPRPAILHVAQRPDRAAARAGGAAPRPIAAWWCGCCWMMSMRRGASGRWRRSTNTRASRSGCSTARAGAASARWGFRWNSPSAAGTSIAACTTSPGSPMAAWSWSAGATSATRISTCATRPASASATSTWSSPARRRRRRNPCSTPIGRARSRGRPPAPPRPRSGRAGCPRCAGRLPWRAARRARKRWSDRCAMIRWTMSATPWCACRAAPCRSWPTGRRRPGAGWVRASGRARPAASPPRSPTRCASPGTRCC